MKNETDKLAEKCESVLASVLSLSFHFLEALRFNRKNLQHLYSVCLFARLIELASGCKALIENNTFVGIPVLLRSMFEANIDLTNMMKCPEYYKKMYASYLEQKIRLLKETASSKPNSFLDTVKERRNPKSDLEKTQKELDKLKGEHNGPIGTRCRAELAGLLDEYLSVYYMLCLDTHNNISSLEDWHLDVNIPDDYHVIAFKQQKSDLIHYLSSIPGILLTQTKALADFLGTKNIDFAPYFAELKAMQDEVEGSITV